MQTVSLFLDLFDTTLSVLGNHPFAQAGIVRNILRTTVRMVAKPRLLGREPGVNENGLIAVARVAARRLPAESVYLEIERVFESLKTVRPATSAQDVADFGARVTAKASAVFGDLSKRAAEINMARARKEAAVAESNAESVLGWMVSVLSHGQMPTASVDDDGHVSYVEADAQLTPRMLVVLGNSLFDALSYQAENTAATQARARRPSLLANCALELDALATAGNTVDKTVASWEDIAAAAEMENWDYSDPDTERELKDKAAAEAAAHRSLDLRQFYEIRQRTKEVEHV